jgi:hypothetical protein
MPEVGVPVEMDQPALAQPGTLVGAGGRRPRLEGADTRPIFMPKKYQINIHGTGTGNPTIQPVI